MSLKYIWLSEDGNSYVASYMDKWACMLQMYLVFSYIFTHLAVVAIMDNSIPIKLAMYIDLL